MRYLSETEVCKESQTIEITAHSRDIFEIKILFPTLEISDRELVDHLREAKKLVSSRHEIPAFQLELREILEKIPTAKGMMVRLTIAKLDLPRGAPKVHLRSLTSSGGVTHADMIAEVDLYPLDESGKPLSLERVKDELITCGVDRRLCNSQLLEETIHRILQDCSPLRGCEVARGVLPDEGRDAEMDWGVFGEPSAEMSDGEQGLKCRVHKGNILCRKNPALVAKRSGKNVRGEIIPPNIVKDFTLVAGEGVGISKDGLILRAAEDGIATLKRNSELIEARVQVLKKLTGDEVTDLVLEDSVEIKGTLQSGSAITTRGDILLEGNIESGSTVKAGENVTIKGKIKNSEISADNSIQSNSDVAGSTIRAGNEVDLQGVVRNSNISGNIVRVRELEGSHILAGDKVTIHRYSTSKENGVKNTINLGRGEFLKNKIETTQKTISTLHDSLDKMGELFGRENVAKLKASNLQQILIQHISSLHLHGDADLVKSRVENLKKLLENVLSLKAILKKKIAEVKLLQKQAGGKEQSYPVLEIHEKNSEPIEVIVNGKPAKIRAEEDKKKFTFLPDGTIETASIQDPSDPALQVNTELQGNIWYKAANNE